MTPSIKSVTGFKNKVFLSSKINPKRFINSYILSFISPFVFENISSNLEFNVLIPSNLFPILEDNKFLNPF